MLAGISAGYDRDPARLQLGWRRLLLRREAVAQLLWAGLGVACGVGVTVCSGVGPLLGPGGGDVVTVELGQVVSRHQ